MLQQAAVKDVFFPQRDISWLSRFRWLFLTLKCEPKKKAAGGCIFVFLRQIEVIQDAWRRDICHACACRCTRETALVIDFMIIARGERQSAQLRKVNNMTEKR